MLRSSVASVLEIVSSNGCGRPVQFGMSANGEALYDKIQGLSPKDDAQRSIQSQAVSTLMAMGQTRLLLAAQKNNSVSLPMLVVLVAWLDDYFHQLRFVRPSQSDCDSQFVGLRSFGFRRGLLNLGNVLPLCRTDPRLRRPNPRRPRTPGPVVTSRKESWPRRRASRLILHAASGPFRLGVL